MQRARERGRQEGKEDIGVQTEHNVACASAGDLILWVKNDREDVIFKPLNSSTLLVDGEILNCM